MFLLVLWLKIRSSDNYIDSLSDYQCNEVANDYNAGFIGVLAKCMISMAATLFLILSLMKRRVTNSLLKQQ